MTLGGRMSSPQLGTDFFTVGGTLSPDDPSYIVRSADDELFESLMKGEFAFILDSRQKGKSSLIARAMVQLNAAGVSTVRIDLQQLGSNLGTEQWYAGLLNVFGRDLGLTKQLFQAWGQHQNLGPMARFFEVLARIVLTEHQSPIVVFIDEVDYVRSLPFGTDEFFAGIRECFNRRAHDAAFKRLTFCLAGVATPSQLITNVAITPFNIGRQVSLSDFTLKEAMAFAPALSNSGRDGGALLERIHFWTNGHPYLTQALCSIVSKDESLESEAQIDHLVQETLLSPESRQREPNLLDVSRRILEANTPGLEPEEARIQILGAYRQLIKGKKLRVDDSEWHLACLRLSGAVREQDGHLSVRNRIYGTVFNLDWIQANMPNAELRRQRAAAFKAAFRTGGLALLVIGVIAWLAVNNWKLAEEARKGRDKAQYESYVSSMLLASDAGSSGDVDMVKTLVEEQSYYPHKGWEWSYWKNNTVAFTIPDDDGSAYEWRWGADGSKLYATYNDSIRCYDATTSALVWKIERQTETRCVVFELPGGRVLDMAFDGETRIWDIATERVVFRTRTPGIAFRNDTMLDQSRRFVTGDFENKFWVLDLETGGLRSKDSVAENYPARPNFGDGGRTIVGVRFKALTKTGGSSVVLVDRKSLRIKRIIPVRDTIQTAYLSNNGKWVLAGHADGWFDVFDASTGAAHPRMKLNSAEVWRMDFCDDDSLVSVAGLDSVSHILSTNGGNFKVVGEIKSPGDFLISPNGKRLMYVTYWARVLEVERILRGPVTIPKGNRYASVTREPSAVWSVDGEGNIEWQSLNDDDPIRHRTGFRTDFKEWFDTRIPLAVVRDQDNRRWIFDFATQRTVCSVPESPTEYIGAVYVKALDSYILRSTDEHVSLFDPRSEKVNVMFGGRHVASMVPTPDQKLFILSDYKGGVAIWNPTTNQLREVTNNRMSQNLPIGLPDNRHFICGNDAGTLVITDALTAKVERILRGHSDTSIAVALSPDGKRLASTSYDRTVRVWDTSTWRTLAVLPAGPSRLWGVEWVDDGKTIVATDAESRIFVWRSQPK